MADPVLVSIIHGDKRTNFRRHWCIGPGRTGGDLMSILSSVQKQQSFHANAPQALSMEIDRCGGYESVVGWHNVMPAGTVRGDWERAILLRYEGTNGHSGADDLQWTIGWVAQCNGELDSSLDKLAHWRSVESFRAFCAMHKVLEQAEHDAVFSAWSVQKF